MPEKAYPVIHVATLPAFAAPLSAWEDVPVISDFSRPWNPTAPVPLTEFRAVNDGETLAFRFDVEDDDLVLADGETQKDRAAGSDRAEIFLATNAELEPYYCLEMDPRGNILENRANHYRQMDWSWSMQHLKLATAILSDGYRVEGHMKLDELRELGVLREDGRIRAGIFRANFSRDAAGETITDWMPWIDPETEKPDFHVPEAFGLMQLE